MKKQIKSAETYFIYAFAILLLFYAADLIAHYLMLDKNRMFGYLDLQAHWQSVYDLLQGKVLYRDFYWEYGIFMLLIRVPLHLLLGQTHFSNLVNSYFLLPIAGIFLSYILAKQYLNKKALIIFLFLMLLYRANNDYNAIRHLIPELGLLTAMMGLIQNNKNKRLLGSLLLGISLTSSPEYALMANLSYVIFVIIYYLRNRKEIRIPDILLTLSFQFAIGLFYLTYLTITGALGMFFTFTREQINAFYTDSPCREVFPRLEELQAVFQQDATFFSNLFYLFYRINIYGVFVAIILLIIWNIRHRKSKYFLLNIILLGYSVLAYGRTVNTPCYFHYGVTFIILLICRIFTSEDSSKRTKSAALIIIIWLILGSRYWVVLENMYKYIVVPTLKYEKIYFEPAGMKIDRELADSYEHVKKYITERTDTNDTVFVYPDGPYNQILDRKSPVAPYSSLYYGLAPSLIDPTYKQLRDAKPKYVIINRYNSSSYVSAVRGVQYDIHDAGGTPVFQGITTTVENYVSENYEIVDKNKIAWILEKRNKPIQLQTYYIPISVKSPWNIKLRNLTKTGVPKKDEVSLSVTDSQFSLMLGNDFTGGEMIIIPAKFDLGIIKPVSKFVYRLHILASNGQTAPIKTDFITSEWQDITAYIPQLPESLSVRAVIIEASDNLGFYPFGRPQTIMIKIPILYKKNNLDISDSIMKK